MDAHRHQGVAVLCQQLIQNGVSFGTANAGMAGVFVKQHFPIYSAGIQIWKDYIHILMMRWREIWALNLVTRHKTKGYYYKKKSFFHIFVFFCCQLWAISRELFYYILIFNDVSVLMFSVYSL